MIGAEHLARLMPGYLPRQRWFGGADRTLLGVRTVAHEVWRDQWPGLIWALVEADLAPRPGDDGSQPEEPPRFQVFVGLRPLEHAENFLEGKGRWLLGDVTTDEGPALAYDAFVDPELALEVLARVAPELHATTMRPLAVEQSNTSVVFDEHWILKAFRRVHAGPNPDVEVSNALEEAGFAHVPASAGSWSRDGADLAVVRRYVSGGSDGFDLARTSLRDLYDARVAPGEAGGDFAPESARLGQLTAQLHLGLADAFGADPAEPARWANELVAELGRIDAPGLPDGRVAEVYAALAGALPSVAGASIRVHGDFHLGQVLRGDEGWFVLDFEGEPDRPVAERRFTSSPLRDVAGMLRSFAYAPEVVLSERGEDAVADPELRALGVQWEEHNRRAFLEAYYAQAGIDALLPRDGAMRATVLAAFELGKAVYEVGYEQGHRPTWLHIPMGAVQRLSAAATAALSADERGGDAGPEPETRGTP